MSPSFAVPLQSCECSFWNFALFNKQVPRSRTVSLTCSRARSATIVSKSGTYSAQSCRAGDADTSSHLSSLRPYHSCGSLLEKQLSGDPERASHCVQVPFAPQAREEVEVKGTAGSLGRTANHPTLLCAEEQSCYYECWWGFGGVMEPHPAQDAGAHVGGSASHSHPHNLESWEEKESRQEGADSSSPCSEGCGQLRGMSGPGNVLVWGEDTGADTSPWIRNPPLNPRMILGAGGRHGQLRSQPTPLCWRGRERNAEDREQRAGPGPGLFITLPCTHASSGKGT